MKTEIHNNSIEMETLQQNNQNLQNQSATFESYLNSLHSDESVSISMLQKVR